MAGSIKGITVEIGGNTGPLENALKDVNKESRSLQSELKAVDKNLKFNPKDVVMLTQKQKLLAESITNTKSKLQTLKEAEKQAEEQFKQGKISEEQYRALQREISKTTNELKILEREQSALGSSAAIKLKASGEHLKDVGNKVTNVGKQVSKVSAGVSAGLTAGVAAYKNVKSGIDEVTKATGATGKAADKLKESFKNVASQTGADMATLGQTMGEVNTRFDFTGKKLEDCTLQFTKFAKITGTDAKTSVQLVSRAMGDAGIKSTEYSKVLDMLAVAAQKSGVDVSKLTENLAKYGAPMRALGIDTKNSIALFAGWEKAGVNTEIAFSGMKKAISNWGKEGKNSGEEFKKVMQEIKNAPDISKATEIAIANFGQKAGPDLADAIKGGRFAVDDYIKALDNSKDSVNNTFNQMKDGTEQIQIAFNAAKVAGSELGQTIIAMLAPILQKVAEKAKQLATWMGSLSPEAKKIAVLVAVIVAAIGPLILTIGKLITAIGNIKIAMAFLASNPIVLVITAIVAAVIALIAIIKHLWDTNKQFRTAIISIWNGIKSVFITVVNALKTVWNGFKTAFMVVVNAIKTAWNALASVLKTVWNGFVTAIKLILAPFIIYFKVQFEIIKTVFTVVVGVLKQLWSALCVLFKTVFGPVVEFIKSAWNSFKDTFTSACNSIKSVWNTICNALKTIFSPIVEAIKTLWSGFKSIFTTVCNAVKSVWDNICNSLKSVWSAVTDNLKTAWLGVKVVFGAVCDALKTVWNGLCNTLKAVFGPVVNAIKTLWNGIKNVFSSVCNTIKSAWNTVCNGIHNTWTNLVNKIKSAWNTITAPFRVVVDKIKSIWSSVRSAFKLPHFSLKGKLSLDPPSVPHINVDWYSKGGIFTKPTIFNGAIGVGDMYNGKGSNAEAVVPLDELWEHIDKLVNSNKGINQVNNFYSKESISPGEYARKTKQSLREILVQGE